MRASIIAIGTELLGADRSDTNSLFLADVLSRHGVGLRRKVIVGDVLEEIQAEIERAREDSQVLLITGGLGPTQDDLTREAVAATLSRTVEEDPKIVDDIRRKFASFGREMPEVNKRQANVIAGATVLANARGTAPGLFLEDGPTFLYLFPGVPHELYGLVEEYLEPWLAELTEGGSVERRVLRLACLPESDLEEKLEPFYRKFGSSGVSILPSPGEITLRLTVSGSPAERTEWLEPRADLLVGALEEYTFGTREDVSLEGEVGRLLLESGKTVATAESCTGGGLAERLTAVPGSSAYFLGSVVAYSNVVKEELLGVSTETLASHGAVSSQTAEELASGVLDQIAADYGVAITGIAGPGGGSDEKPVGTVYLGLARRATPDNVTVQRYQLPGDRTRIRRLTTQWALDLLRRELLGRLS